MNALVTISHENRGNSPLDYELKAYEGTQARSERRGRL